MDTPVVVVAPALPADEADEVDYEAAREREEDERREERARLALQRPLANGGAEIVLGFGREALPLGTLAFHGSGRALGLSTSQAFDATGKQVGFVHPTLSMFEASVAYTRRHLAVGALFQAGGGLGPDATPTSSNDATIVAGGSLTVVAGGFELYGVLPVQPVTLRLGAVAGVRDAVLQLRGFELTTCRSKSGSFPCAETASAVAPFLEPRVALDVAIPPVRGGKSVVLALGGWAGADVAPAYGWSLGLTLAARVPYWSQRP